VPEGQAAGALVVEVSTARDLDRASRVLENARATIPVWIFDPGATPDAADRWKQKGAAQVLRTITELDELVKADRRSSWCGAQQAETRVSLIGASSAIRRIECEIAQVANHRCNLLIEGATGTGKEVVARKTHEAGNRARGPWVAVNCGAIPEQLLEAELFGHMKGAFTGAVQSRAGKFETANHGTIFLDEIGDMPLATQGRLLRVLQEREIERLGGNERIQLDVRVIAATNVNLAEQVRRGNFRQDLYYRLNVFRIAVPALRDRPEDIPVLATYFLEKNCAMERIPVKGFDSAAMDRLREHKWPGNVRELENCVETSLILSGKRQVVLASDVRIDTAAELTAGPQRELQASGFQPAGNIAVPPEGLDYQRALEEFEKSLLNQALARTRGNKTAAADLLGLKRTTLAAKMRVLEARRPRLVA